MLRLGPVNFIKPKGLFAALVALDADPESRALAGGTDLVVQLKHRLSAASTLVSLADCGLSRIASDDGGVTIGAGVTLWDLARSTELSGPNDIIRKAAGLVASGPIQSRATLGGNLALDSRCNLYNQSEFWRSGRPACFKAGGIVCHVAPGGGKCHACHMSDLPAALIALDATAKVASAFSERVVPVEQLYTGEGLKPLALERNELIVSVRVPKLQGGAGFEKFRVRKGLDFALAIGAAYVEKDGSGVVTKARVAISAVGGGPVVVEEAANALIGSKLEPEALEKAAQAASAAAKPMKNSDLTPAYRKKMAGVAVKRAAQTAGGEG